MRLPPASSCGASGGSAKQAGLCAGSPSTGLARERCGPGGPPARVFRGRRRFWDFFTPTWQLTEPSTSRRSWVTLLSLKGRCRCPLSTPRMTFPSPACALVSSSVMWMARFTWVMLPPRVLVRSQQPKSIRWRRLRPPRRDGVAGVEGFRLKTLRYNSL